MSSAIGSFTRQWPEEAEEAEEADEAEEHRQWGQRVHVHVAAVLARPFPFWFIPQIESESRG